jgi:hypothetical protein
VWETEDFTKITHIEKRLIEVILFYPLFLNIPSIKKMLKLFPKILRPVSQVRRIKDFRGFAPAAGANFPDVIRDALAAGGLVQEADSVLNKLSAAKINDVKVAVKLTNDDWSSIGVNIGERIVIQEALEASIAAKPKLARMGSRGGSPDTHQRSL